MGDAPRERWLRHSRAIAVAFALAIALAGIHQHGLWAPDEPREAEMGREMLASGFSALPTLGGAPFLEKPPLFFWAMAASFRLFGVNEGAARLPAALSTAAAIALAYALGRRCGGRATGLCAAVVLASFAGYWSVSHRAVNDTALTAFVAASHLLLLRGRDALVAGRRTFAFAGAGLCVGLAFMTKGPVGPILAVGPPLLALLAQRDWVVLKGATLRAAAWSLLFVAALATPWAFALARHPGGWSNVEACLLGQAIGRVVGDETMGAHAEGIGFYFVRAPIRWLPWIACAPAFLLSAPFRRWWRRPAARYAALVVVAGLALLSIPAGKRVVYLTPLLPMAAVIPGAWLARASVRSTADRRVAFVLLGTLGAVALFGGAVALGVAVRFTPALRALHGLSSERVLHVGMAIAGLGLAAWCAQAWRTVKRRSAADGALAPTLLPLVAAGLFVTHVVGRPLLDPRENLRPAALAIAAAVPRDEPIVAFHATETQRAVVPFYSGRMLGWLRTRDRDGDPLAELAARGARHLVVFTEHEARQPDPALLRSLRPVATIAPELGCPAIVYEVASGGD